MAQIEHKKEIQASIFIFDNLKHGGKRSAKYNEPCICIELMLNYL